MVAYTSAVLRSGVYFGSNEMCFEVWVFPIYFRKYSIRSINSKYKLRLVFKMWRFRCLKNKSDNIFWRQCLNIYSRSGVAIFIPKVDDFHFYLNKLNVCQFYEFTGEKYFIYMFLLNCVYFISVLVFDIQLNDFLHIFSVF